MPEIIDSLLLEIGLDPKDFKKGMEESLKYFATTKNQATSAAKEMEERGKQAAQFFANIKTEALGLIAVFTAGMGIKNFTADTVKTSVSLDNLSKNINMSAKDISAWQLLIKEKGGDGNAILGTLERVSAMSAKYRKGFGGTPDMFRRAGGDIEELKKGAQSYLLETSRVLNKVMKESGRDMAYSLASDMMIDKDTFNAIIGGKTSTLSGLNQAKELNPLSDKDRENIAALNKEWVDFSENMSFTAKIILSELTPQLQQLMGFLNKIGEWIREHKAGVSEWAQGMINGTKFAVDDIKSLWGTIKEKAGYISEEAKNSSPNSPGPFQERMSREGSLTSDSPQELFAKLENQYGIEPGLLNAIYLQESGGGKHLLSNKGAKGPFQFLDDTAKQYGITDPYNLEQSAEGAAKFIRDLSKKYGGDRHKILAGYNWGQGHLDSQGIENAPLQTTNYFRDVDQRMAARNSTTNNTTNITGPITIHTQATDGDGIKRSLQEEARQKSLLTQSETGMR